jgi:hypothetical protein
MGVGIDKTGHSKQSMSVNHLLEMAGVRLPRRLNRLNFIAPYNNVLVLKYVDTFISCSQHVAILYE